MSSSSTLRPDDGASSNSSGQPPSPMNRSRRASATVRFSLDDDVRAALRSPPSEPISPNEDSTTPSAFPQMVEPPRTAAAPPRQFVRRNRDNSLRSSLFKQHAAKPVGQSDTIIEMTPSAATTREEPKMSPASSIRKPQPTVTMIEEEDSEDSDDLSRTRTLSKRLSDSIHSASVYQQWVSGVKPKPALYYKVEAIFNKFQAIIDKMHYIPPSVDGRHIHVITDKSQERMDDRTKKPYIDNTIRSTRYTMWNFLPKQLWAQFGKLANFYFLAIAILQMVPGLSTTGTYTTIIPLLIFVSISMTKEGYDDYRRKKLDKEENERTTFVLDRGLGPPVEPTDRKKSIAASVSHSASFGWRQEKWQDLRVGDVILLHRDELVPADIILLHSDDETNTAYIETKSLDGETNLKNKRPVNELTKYCHDIDSVGLLNAEFVVEDPNLDLYKFEGKMTWRGEVHPVTNSEVVYRGCTLRNTRTAIGLVIYSGEECKIRMNANKNPRVKAPAMQAIVNRVVILVASIVFFIAIILTVLYQVWRAKVEIVGWYLLKARIPFGPILTSFIIMFNTMLPLSLYVSMEIVKLIQMIRMNDIDMYDAESDIPMEPRTSTINEELGQVSYIFSDKTGTLTNNSMRFRKMSIAGTAWLHDKDIQEELAKDPNHIFAEKQKRTKKSKRAQRKMSEVGPHEGQMSHGEPQVIEAPPPAKMRRASTATLGEWQPSSRPTESLHTGKTEDLLDYLRRKPQTLFARKVRAFIMSLALCHTCLPEKDDNGKITFQAASPDEMALVTAAQDLGWEVIDRSPSVLTVRYYQDGDKNRPVEERFEVLDVIEFTSARKRMSIIMRMPDNRICLFTKGADTTIRGLLRLTSLAAATTTLVERRASQRKSMEVQEVLRRKSVQHTNMARTKSVGNPSGAPHLNRRSSVAGQITAEARASLDEWLREREEEVTYTTPRKSNQYYATPRHSLQLGPSGAQQPQPQHYFPGRSSMGHYNSDTSDSEMTDDDDEYVDEGIVVNDAAVFERCFQHIDDFATEGLRTLLYASRFMTDHEYIQWKELYRVASTSLVDRDKKMEQVGEMIEINLELLGATAIEDKLQKGVPEAIDRLRRAGIKMWMLTGDKRETAINIGNSCRLIKDYSTICILDHTAGDLQSQLTSALNVVRSRKTAHSVLVIDGGTLTIIDAEPESKLLFTDLAIKADAVVCCRASPSQKAGLVRTIRTKVKGSVTLAIGDGANDIAMIQEAHLGIGIAGKEGLQAARSSDYSIGQFRFLTKLLLVHGRWNYIRIAKYTLGTFWKEMVFYMVQALYQRYNGYTGTSYYEPWSMSMFNTLFTSLPVILMGVFEQDLKASTLLAVPELYNYGQRNRGFNFGLYVWWATQGTVESIIIYFSSISLFGLVPYTRDNSLYGTSCLSFTAVVILVSFKLQILDLHNKTIAAAIGLFLSIGGWWAWNLALSAFYPADPIYSVKRAFLVGFGRNALWWFVLGLVLLAVFMVEVFSKVTRATLDPSDVDIFQQLEKDPEVTARFEDASADLLSQGWLSAKMEKKGSVTSVRSQEEEAAREADIEELLSRPRTMETPVKPSQAQLRPEQARPKEMPNKGLRAGLPQLIEVPTPKIESSEFFQPNYGMR